MVKSGYNYFLVEAVTKYNYRTRQELGAHHWLVALREWRLSLTGDTSATKQCAS